MRSSYVYAFFIVAVGFFYWLLAKLTLDPDFGWHIRMGQLILAKGVPATDPFSYTMPSYPVVGHEWLSGILFVKLYSIIGYGGLATVFTMIAISALWLQWHVVKAYRKFGFIPFLLAIMTIINFFGIRPQVISWLFFSMLLVVTADFEHFRRWRWWLPFLFLFWANLHGGFAIGIATFLLACVYWTAKGRQSLWVTSGIFLLCLGATFINPYGWRIWWEVWMTVSDGMLRWTIVEWLPSFFIAMFPFWTFFVLSVFLVVRYRKKFIFLDFLMFSILSLLALSSLRHIPLWALIGLPLTVKGIDFLSEEARGIKYGQERFLKAFKVFTIIACIICVPSFLSIFLLLSNKGGPGYPEKAVAYLRAYMPKKQIFSTYDWGGFLIWKLPEKKTFVDGRMAIWRWEAHIPGESDYAFNDYLKFMAGKLSFASTTKKYHISTLLLPYETSGKKNPFMRSVENFEDSVVKRFNLFLLDKKLTNFSTLVSEAKKVGWVEVYRDNTAVIYQDRRIEDQK